MELCGIISRKIKFYKLTRQNCNAYVARDLNVEFKINSSYRVYSFIDIMQRILITN